MARHGKTVILAVFLIGVVFLPPTEGFFSYNPFKRAASLFDGHEFWSQFQQGFKQLEGAAKDEVGKIESAKAKNGVAKDEDTGTDLLDISGSSDLSFGFPGSFLSNLFGGMNTGLAMAREPWWKGQNVCVEREEIDESQHHNRTDVAEDEEGGVFGSFQFSSCQQTDLKYTCTTKIRNHGIRKTFIVKYQCCHGFKRVEGKPGCTEGPHVDIRIDDTRHLNRTATQTRSTNSTVQ